MHTLFLLNPTAGKTDCTRTLPQQIEAAAARAGLAPEAYTIQVTTHAGHARELANAAARQARQAGETLRIYTAGGDGTFNEALTGAYGYENTAVGCLPFGSGNDFLRTFGTKEEFLDLDAQLAGGPVSIDLMDTIVDKKSKDPEKFMKIFNRFSEIITLVFIVLFGVFYFQYLMKMAQRPQVSASMHINMLIPMSTILIGVVLMVYHSVCRLFYSYETPAAAAEE